MKDTLRVGIIGCGNFTLGQNLPNVLQSDLLEPLWLCDCLPEAVERAAGVCVPGVGCSVDPQEVLSDDSVDAVILAVPHSEHEKLVVAAAEAGKHIFTEKPLAMTMEEAYRIRRAVRRSGVKLCVDFNRGSSPAMQDLKRLYWEHRRHPRNAPGQFVAAQRETLPEERASTFLCRVQDESTTYGPVHLDWHTGGGEIIGETCHWLELICWMFEDDPVRVFASGSARMSHVLTLDFPGGHQGVILFSVTGTFRYPKELYEITCNHALLRSHCLVENEYFGLEGETGRAYPLKTDELPDVGPEGGLSGYVAKVNAQADLYAQTGRWAAVGPDKGHFHLLEGFARAVLEDRPTPVDARAGARATYLALRAIESLRHGHPVPVNLEDLDMFVW